ncbi:MAG: hypothetical protein HFF18_02110 [Oscillospiraceae bacterium]|nr:hypothetical protein [Oscillospiraceae bacterium]
MIGQLIWTGERRLRVRLTQERVRGALVIRAELPGLPEDRGAARRKARGLYLLEREGCGRLLSPGEEALPGVSTRPLWQSVAAPLALSFFQRHGQRPELARVALEGDRITRPLFTACCQLITAVRGISLARCPGSEELAWWLERQYGVPVSSGGGDVTVRFRPGPGGGDCLALGGEVPSPPGFSLALKEEQLPEEYPRLPLMTVLLEEGRIRPDQVRVVPEDLQKNV